MTAALLAPIPRMATGMSKGYASVVRRGQSIPAVSSGPLLPNWLESNGTSGDVTFASSDAPPDGAH